MQKNIIHKYSNSVIEAAMLLRQVSHRPLRQTEGLMNSLARVMKADIAIPDFSSISKRSIALPRHVLSKAMKTGSLAIIDSIGLKVYGRDEWHKENTTLLLGAPGANRISRSMNTIRFWRAN